MPVDNLEKDFFYESFLKSTCEIYSFLCITKLINTEKMLLIFFYNKNVRKFST